VAADGAQGRYIAWMVANRGENPEILSERFDRYEQISGIGDLYTATRSARSC